MVPLIPNEPRKYNGLLFVLATAYRATVKVGNFKTAANFGSVRATEVMNCKSSNNFRWSVRLENSGTYIGITSKLQARDAWVESYDQNSIIYLPLDKLIWYKGKSSFKCRILSKATSGDEIHFKFQPKLKNFSISLVRSVFLQNKSNCYL